MSAYREGNRKTKQIGIGGEQSLLFECTFCFRNQVKDTQAPRRSQVAHCQPAVTVNPQTCTPLDLHVLLRPSPGNLPLVLGIFLISMTVKIARHAYWSWKDVSMYPRIYLTS